MFRLLAGFVVIALPITIMLSTNDVALARVLGIFTQATPTPTPIVIPTITLVPTPTITPYIDPDPIVNCESSYPNCKGSTIKARRSQCSKITCCGFNDGKWIVYETTAKCNEAQKSVEPKLVSCVLSYGTFNLTESKCSEYKAKDGYAPSTYTYPTLIPVTTTQPQPVVDYAAQNQKNIELRADCLGGVATYQRSQQAIINARRDLGLSSKVNLTNSLTSQCDQMRRDCESKYPTY